MKMGVCNRECITNECMGRHTWNNLRAMSGVVGYDFGHMDFLIGDDFWTELNHRTFFHPLDLSLTFSGIFLLLVLC